MARLGECFVRMQIEQIATDDSDFSDGDLKKHIYNPNEMNDPDLCLMNLFKPLADVVIDNTNKGDPLDLLDIQEKGQQIRNKYSDIFKKVQAVSHDRFRQILIQNSGRHDRSLNERKSNGIQFREIENVINAVCHPKTVNSACQLYLQQIQSENNKNKIV